MTRAVVDVAAGVDGLRFELIGEVGLKGFSEPTELFIASRRASGRCDGVELAGGRSASRSAPAGCSPRTGRVVAMLSGGRDSVCLLDVAVALAAAATCSALHVNYGLRAEADEDERHCAQLCERLGVELEVVRAERRRARADGQPAGVGARGALRAALAAARGCATADRSADGASIATGHTATDQVETILYRLAASPGGARCWGWPPRGAAGAPAAGAHARADRRLLRGARARLARGREQRRRAVRARARAPRAAAGARAVHPARGGQRAAHRRAAARGDRAAGRARRRASSRRRGRIAIERLRELPPRWRAWSSCAWPRTPPAPTCPRPAIAWRRSSRSADAAARAELHVGGLVGRGDRGRRAAHGQARRRDYPSPGRD